MIIGCYVSKSLYSHHVKPSETFIIRCSLGKEHHRISKDVRLWDHKLQTIVILTSTKPVEAGSPKCAVYWPEKVNKTSALKPSLHVRMTYLQYFADFDMLAFEVTNVSNK